MKVIEIKTKHYQLKNILIRLDHISAYTEGFQRF